MRKKYPKAVELPSGSYRCQVRVDGRRVSVTADSPQEAISRAMALRDGRKEKGPQDLTLEAVVEEYIDLREAVLSPATVKAYRSYSRNRFQPYMKKRISELDRRTLQRMVSDEARTVKPKTVRNAFGLITAALSEHGVDAEGINLPSVPAAERPWLTADEVLRFSMAVHGERCEIPALLALCSLRRSEIAALDWKDIDLKKEIIHVRRSVVIGEDGLVEKKTNKTRSSTRDVPILIPQLADALRKVEDKTGRVMKGHPNSVYNQVNRICRREGLPEVGVHGLRHSYASLCHYLGIPPMEAAKMGGWSDLNTMNRIYTHLSSGQMTAAAEQFRSFFSHFEMP